MDIDKIFDDITSSVKNEDATEGFISDEKLNEMYLTEEEIVMEKFKDTKIGNTIFKKKDILKFNQNQRKIDATKALIDNYREKVRKEKSKNDDKNIKKIRKYEMKISQLSQLMKKLIAEGKRLKKNIEMTESANSDVYKESKDDDIYDNSKNIYETYVEEYGNDFYAIRSAIENDYFFDEDMTESTFTRLLGLCYTESENSDKVITESATAAAALLSSAIAIFTITATLIVGKKKINEYKKKIEKYIKLYENDSMHTDLIPFKELTCKKYVIKAFSKNKPDFNKEITSNIEEYKNINKNNKIIYVYSFNNKPIIGYSYEIKTMYGSGTGISTGSDATFVNTTIHDRVEDFIIYDKIAKKYREYYITKILLSNKQFSSDMTNWIDELERKYSSLVLSESENYEEFSVGSMLPQALLSDVSLKYDEFGEPIEDDPEEVRETCYEEDQIVYSLTNENSDYDLVTSDCIHTLMEAAIPHINLVSERVQDIIGKKAYLVTKYNYLKESADPVKLRYIKRETIATEQELRSLMKGFSEKSNKLIVESTNFLKDILENSITEETDENDSKVKGDPAEKEKQDSTSLENDTEFKKPKDEQKKQSAELTSESMKTIDLTQLGMKDLLKCKLYFEDEISSMRTTDLKVVEGYNNKLKYINSKLENSEFVEAANIEEEIQPIIYQLNGKGYVTRYSSPGHTNVTKKDDKKKDGIIDGKLYIDARIMFDDNFNFKKPPEGWIKRKVDGCDYIQPEEIRYNKKDGTPQEAKEKWKKRYMSALSIWVEELPDISKDNNSSDTNSNDANNTDTNNDENSNNSDNTNTNDNADVNVEESYQSMLDDLTFEMNLMDL